MKPTRMTIRKPAFPVIKAAFYLSLARRGQYLKVISAADGTGMLEVLTAEKSYCMTVAEKAKADRALANGRPATTPAPVQAAA